MLSNLLPQAADGVQLTSKVIIDRHKSYAVSVWNSYIKIWLFYTIGRSYEWALLKFQPLWLIIPDLLGHFLNTVRTGVSCVHRYGAGQTWGDFVGLFPVIVMPNIGSFLLLDWLEFDNKFIIMSSGLQL